MPSERCEPPEALRKRGGWHWLVSKTAEDQDFYPYEWFNGAWVQLSHVEMWRYVAPVPDPAAVAALVRAGHGLLTWAEDIERQYKEEWGDETQTEDTNILKARTALLPFADWPDKAAVAEAVATEREIIATLRAAFRVNALRWTGASHAEVDEMLDRICRARTPAGAASEGGGDG